MAHSKSMGQSLSPIAGGLSSLKCRVRSRVSKGVNKMGASRLGTLNDCGTRGGWGFQRQVRLPR